MRRIISSLTVSALTALSAPALAVTADAPEEVPVEAPATTVAPPQPTIDENDPRQRVVISGYAQGQYEKHQDSSDELRPGGALQNQDRFSLRRGRLKAEREWKWSSLMLEIDGNTTSGPDIRVHHAEASLLYRGDNAIDLPPMVRVTFGLFDVPFGYELVESPRTRPFMERSIASRALFPIEPDLGVRIGGAVGWLRYSFAVINGEPLGAGNKYGWRDPNGAKDWVAHVGAVAQPAKDAEIGFGVSFYNGMGFTPGKDATKNSVVWKDPNENGAIDSTSEIAGQPGVAATQSRTFERWMVGADLQIRLKTKLGFTRLFGEAYIASDMDRGLYVADPNTAAGIHTRELGYYAAIVQDIHEWGMVGFRTELYDPNADYLEKQAGSIVPLRQVIRVYSPMVAWTVDPRTRLVFQYDIIRDKFGRREAGLPIDLKNDTWTLRLQVQL